MHSVIVRDCEGILSKVGTLISKLSPRQRSSNEFEGKCYIQDEMMKNNNRA